MQDTSPLIWVLADDKAGHRHQAIGVAQALGLPYIVKELSYTSLAALPNILKGASFLGLTRAARATLTAPWPDIVIAAGRRTAPVARAIKRKGGRKKEGRKPFLAQLMWPGPPVWDFGLIAVPEHDDMTPSDKVITTLGAPHHLNHTVLGKAKEEWQETLGSLPRPHIVVLAGGGTGKRAPFTEAQAARLAYVASRMAGQAEGALLITTSRRTPPAAAQRLKAGIACEHYWYDYAENKPNPYLGLLAHADAIIATGDSISMCSEACYTGKPLFIQAPENLPKKHRKFLDRLFEEGYARPLPENGETPDLESWRGRDGRKLDEAHKVAAEIKKRVANLG